MKTRKAQILAFAAAILAIVFSLQTAFAQQEPLLSCSDTNNILHGRTKKVADQILGTLRLSNCLLLTNPSQLTAITNLGISGLTSLEAGDFANLPNLQTLRILHSPQLRTLPSDLFNNLTNLQTLMVDNFSASDLPSDLLDDLTQLQTLQLSGNARLTTVPPGFFNNLTNLTRLNLSNTPQLASLPSGIFDNLAKLTRLDLQTGQLTSLPNGLFNNLTNLTWLDVSGHRLASLSSGAFDNLTKLAVLNLGNNRLTSLPDNIFDKLTKLRWLVIGGNRLTSLPSGVFDKLPILRTLYLSYNPNMPSLPAGVFDKLTELEYLFIENSFTTPSTGLISLSANVFSKTTKLKQLDISGNQFTSLPGNVFDNLVNLDFLDLRNNALTSLPLSEGIFDDLVSLNRQNLYLTGNPVYTNLLTNTLSVTIVPSTMEVVEGDEGTKNANFQVLLGRGILTNSITINYATRDGTATEEDNDYSPISGQWIFAGDWRQGQSFSGQWLRENILNLSIPIRGDVVEEEDETFELVLTRSSSYTADEEFAASVTILDNDALPEVALSLPVTSFSVAEGDSGTTTIGFHIQLTQIPNAQVTIDYATVDGTATAPQDYTSRSGTLTFTAGTTNLTQTISIPIRGDTEEESDETFSVRLTNPMNVNFGGGASMRETIITIADDDVLPPPPPSLLLTPSVLEINEGDTGQTNAEFQVRLTRASGQPISINYATANGTATAGQDYTSRSGTLTFAAGTTSLTQTISIPIRGDTLDEPNETFTILLSNPANASLLTSTARCTILDDDAPSTLSLTPSTLTVTEGTTNAEFQVRLNRASGQTISIDYATVNGTATAGQDYTSRSGTLTFAAGTTSLTQTISIPIRGDTLDEPNETFTILLSNPNNASLLTSTARCTILDDDAPSTLSLTPSTLTVTEGTTNAEFQVRLNRASGQPISIDYATVNGTATAGQDYTSRSGTLTFTAGTTNLSQTISIPLVDDTEDEANETFTIQLINPANATLLASTAQTTIVDNDGPAALFLTPSVLEINEGDTGQTNAEFQVRLTRASGQPISINYATANGTATAGQDYTSRSGTLTFTAGTTGLTQTISVPIRSDSLDEPNETFTILLSNPNNASLLTSTARCTILDDDAPSTLSLTPSTLTVTEGTTNAEFQVQLNRASGQTISIDYATVNGTATAGQDYTSRSGTLTFAAGTTNLSQTIAISLVDDTLDEPNETFTIQLINPNNAVFPDGDSQLFATIIIIDEDAPPPIAQRPLVIGFAQTFLSLPEGDEGETNAEFPVQLLLSEGEVLNQVVSVDYATQAGTATAGQDYTSRSGTLIFAAGATSLTQTISVPILGDTLDEPNETFTIQLSNPTNAILHPNHTQAQITDDDQPPPPSAAANPSAQRSFPSGKFPLLIFNTSELNLAEGQTAMYQVRGVSARSPFVSDMIVRIRSNHPQVVVEPQTLVFTTTTLLRFQAVQVRAAAHAADIGEPISIVHSIDASEGFTAHENAGALSVTISSTAAEIETDKRGVEVSLENTIIEPQLPPTDYDRDDDGLIDVSNLAQLHALRFDLNGDGQPDKEEVAAAYKQAFPSAIANMGVPNHIQAQGYELATNLTFDTNGDKTINEEDGFWNKGKGWPSIGSFSEPFQAVFEGNGHTIDNLFQNQSAPALFANEPSGLFGAVGHRAQIVHVVLEGVEIRGVNWVGALAGLSQGVLVNCSVRGRVVGYNSVGGLVGHNFGEIADSHVRGEVRGETSVGGLVGWNVGGLIEGSSAHGEETLGLVGFGTPAAR